MSFENRALIHDFVQKLNKNPETPRNPRRRKTNQILPLHKRLHRSMLVGLGKSTEQVEIYNVGSEDQINVKTIAEIVAEEMGRQVQVHRRSRRRKRLERRRQKHAPKHKQNQIIRLETQTQQRTSH